MKILLYAIIGIITAAAVFWYMAKKTDEDSVGVIFVTFIALLFWPIIIPCFIFYFSIKPMGKLVDWMRKRDTVEEDVPETIQVTSPFGASPLKTTKLYHWLGVEERRLWEEDMGDAYRKGVLFALEMVGGDQNGEARK